jgi:polar amino acid transport system ATP-binding protein
MIDARDVRKRFGHNEVLRGVSLRVARGEVVAVIGPSGSGKSTFLRCLNHLETIDSGHVAIEGQTLATTDAQGRCAYVPDAELRRICAKTGMVFQHFNLFPHLTVLQNLIEPPNATTTPRACRAGRSSAWPSRGRCACSPTSCCSTSPPPRSTPS